MHNLPNGGELMPDTVMNERLFALAGGALLAFAGFRRSPIATLLALLGGALLYHGLVNAETSQPSPGSTSAALVDEQRREALEAQEQQVADDLEDEVDIAMLESFPASDPPSWTAGRKSE